MSKLNEDIIIRYLENRCSEEDFVLINEWMKESDENAGELFRMEEIYQLGKFPFEEENLVVRAERRLGRRLEQENQKKQEVFKLRSVLRYAAAIVGVMVLAAGLAYWFRNKAEELVVASAAHGQVREMLLPDGTKVWLNSLTKLRYPEVLKEDCREVYLTGEAYFEVRKDSLRPFIVRVNGAEVTVLGTSFNVNTYGDDGQIYTTLVNGSVRILSEKNGQEEVLTPGMQGVMNIQTGQLTVREVDVESYVAWREGRFVFRTMTLDLIMHQLQRWYDFEVFYQNPELKEYEFRGVIKRDMDLDKVLSVIKATTNVDFEVKGKVITIIKR